MSASTLSSHRDDIVCLYVCVMIVRGINYMKEGIFSVCDNICEILSISKGDKKRETVEKGLENYIRKFKINRHIFSKIGDDSECRKSAIKIYDAENFSLSFAYAHFFHSIILLMILHMYTNLYVYES